jgi:hypothetical protein
MLGRFHSDCDMLLNSHDLGMAVLGGIDANNEETRFGIRCIDVPVCGNIEMHRMCICIHVDICSTAMLSLTCTLFCLGSLALTSGANRPMRFRAMRNAIS